MLKVSDSMKPLNTLSIAHSFIREHVSEGDFCIDATAGRGRDTALLCELVGESGHVKAFDIQAEALESTESTLEQLGLSSRAELILDGHENMEKYAEAGSAACIVFNFGRLPGGDPLIFSQAETSIRAVDAALRLLKPEGVLCLCIYYGSHNGYDERDALLEHLKNLDDRKYTAVVSEFVNRRGEPPIAAFVWNRG